MTVRLLVSMLAAALIAAVGLASAQDRNIPGQTPPSTQSAPSESSQASGHDAQAGNPETGEDSKNQAGRKKSRDAENKGTAPAQPPK